MPVCCYGANPGTCTCPAPELYPQPSIISSSPVFNTSATSLFPIGRLFGSTFMFIREQRREVCFRGYKEYLLAHLSCQETQQTLKGMLPHASSAAEGRIILCPSPLLAPCLDKVKVSRHMHQEENYSQIISRKMTALGWLPLRYSKYERTTKYKLSLNTNGGRRGRGSSPKPSILQQCTYKGAPIVHVGQMCTLGDTPNIRHFSHSEIPDTC